MDKYKNTLGFIETRGLTAMIYAVDNMLKGSNVQLLGFKRYGSAYLTAAITGSSDDVLNAIKIGQKSVNTITERNPSSQTIKDGLCQLISNYITSGSVIDIIDIFFKKQAGQLVDTTGKAIAFVDARGLISLIAAADKMTKICPVKIMGYHKMGSGRLNLGIMGSIDSVKHAVEIGINTLQEHGKLIAYSIITNPHPDLKYMLK